MKLNRLTFLSAILLAFVIPALAQDSTPEATSAAGPAKITINVPGIQPEGVEYDAPRQRFLISSMGDGKIRQVADDGTTTVFIDDPELRSSVGLQIDTKRNRLLVAANCPGGKAVIADKTQKCLAGLGAYDLDTGKKLFYVDLGSLTQDARHSANDVAVDADGNAYVTDSYAPVIYRVDPEGKAEVFLRDDRFSDPDLGLNGIDYDPQGYLLVAQDGAETIYKVPLSEPQSTTEVKLSQPFAADGMVFGSDGLLYAVAYLDYDLQSIFALSSSDEWATATVTERVTTIAYDDATTLALRDGVPYYIDSYLSKPDRSAYEIVRADLQPVPAATASR